MPASRGDLGVIFTYCDPSGGGGSPADMPVVPFVRVMGAFNVVCAARTQAHGRLLE
jgi:hypothetical protein